MENALILKILIDLMRLDKKQLGLDQSVSEVEFTLDLMSLNRC